MMNALVPNGLERYEVIATSNDNHSTKGGLGPTRVLSSEAQPQTTAATANIARRNGPSSYSDIYDPKHMLVFHKFAFPFKLHRLLDDAEENNRQWSSIVSWTPSGRAFKIHKPKEFAALVMPRYFHQTKYRSFQRQLYIYGFDRVRKGNKNKNKSSEDDDDEEEELAEIIGAYTHELFVRGSADLCLDMTRTKVKGTGESNGKRRGRRNNNNSSSNNNNNNNSTASEPAEQTDLLDYIII